LSEADRGAVTAMHSAPTLVPVSVQSSSDEPAGTIEVEIRRSQTVVQIRWPVSEATACAQ